MTPWAPLFRCLAVWLTVTGLCGGASWLALPAVVAGASQATSGAAGSRPFAEWIAWGAGLATLTAAGWLTVLTTAVTLAAARGRWDHSTLGRPAGLRRLLLLACGVALTAGLAPPVGADPGAAIVRGLALPDRADSVSLPTAHSPTAHSPAARSGVVVVAPGDCLWSIAAATLAAPADDAADHAADHGADDAQVTRRWQAVYRLNRDLIGPDPDLIHPGQRLRLPGPSPHRGEDQR